MKNSRNLRVIVADPCYDEKGLSTPVIPLGAGLVASHAKAVNPDISVEVFKAVSPLIEEIKKYPPDILGLTNYLWNNNLAITIANILKKLNPKALIVFGGPEIDKSPENKSIISEKYSCVDFFIQHEGEVAFANLINEYKKCGLDKDKLKKLITNLGNCFLIENGKIISGPNLHRVENLDETPSPYVTGLFDKFLSNPEYMPMIQTNRGCPFSCTFCQEGQAYFNKVRRHSLKFVQEELDYISQRTDPASGLWITDSNWAMYKWDEDIADHLAKLQKKNGWPRELITSTGKSQLERIIKIAKKLNNTMFISNSVQSMNPDVLKEIKRKNLSPAELEKNRESLKTIRQEPEIIIPLPNETKETFFKGINGLLDSGKNQRFAVFQTLILTNTEMATKATIDRHGLDIKYKQHWNLYGWIDGKFVCETERVVSSTNSMTTDDYLSCRSYAMVLDSILRFEPIHEVFKMLESYKINYSKFTNLLFYKLENTKGAVQECVSKFKENLKAEMHSTEKEVFDYMKKNEKKYDLGLLGGGNLKYSNMLWVEHFEEFLNIIFLSMREVLKDKFEASDEIENLEKYLKLVYFDRLNKKNVPDVVTNYFDYDLLKWSKSDEVIKLSDFKEKIKYNFKKTSISCIEKKYIWKNLGFKLNNEEYDEKEKIAPVGFDNRLYISKLRREISNLS